MSIGQKCQIQEGKVRGYANLGNWPTYTPPSQAIKERIKVAVHNTILRAISRYIHLQKKTEQYVAIQQSITGSATQFISQAHYSEAPIGVDGDSSEGASSGLPKAVGLQKTRCSAGSALRHV